MQFVISRSSVRIRRVAPEKRITAVNSETNSGTTPSNCLDCPRIVRVCQLLRSARATSSRSWIRKTSEGSSSAWSTFHKPDFRTFVWEEFNPNQFLDGASIVSRSKLLRSAIAFRSTRLRMLLGPGASSAGRQMKGIARMCSLTTFSNRYSERRTSAVALFPMPHDGEMTSAGTRLERMSASPIR